MSKVLACIDGLARTVSVCDYAVWAAKRLAAPLEFLHVLQREPDRGNVTDFSGAIGMDAQENLLTQLSALDEQRSKLAQEHGRQILDGARRRAEQAGIDAVETRQRHGALVETLIDLEHEARLMVLGQHESDERYARWHLDQNAERVLRSVRKPVMVVASGFRQPQSFVIAFDASRTGKNMVQTVADSPLLRGLVCHVVSVSDDHAAANDHLLWAASVLSAAGFDVQTQVKSGEPEAVVREHVKETGADLLVMGAYGHSRIRHLVMGSTTSALLRTSSVPVLILR